MAQKKVLSPLEERLNYAVARLFPIPYIQKIFFVTHLRVMLKAGISLVESLTVLQKEIANPIFKKMIAQVIDETAQGKPLNETLHNYPKIFPIMYTNMVAAGEMSGNLVGALEQVELQMKRTKKLTSSIRGAMVYPAIIVGAMCIIGAIMVIFVLPKLTALFTNFSTALPLPTRILLGISNALSNPTTITILLISIAATVIGITQLIKRVPKATLLYHNLTLRFPITGKIATTINLARFSFTLSSLLQSAVPIVQSLRITAEACTNHVYKKALFFCADRMEQGEPLSSLLSAYPKIFPPITTEMILVGEKTGEINTLLKELASFYSEEIEKTLKNLTTIIEPLIILILGFAVSGVALAIIMPMYSLVELF